jgi:hypothetical protein
MMYVKDEMGRMQEKAVVAYLKVHFPGCNEGMQEEGIVAYFKVLFWYLPGRHEVNTKSDDGGSKDLSETRSLSGWSAADKPMQI